MKEEQRKAAEEDLNCILEILEDLVMEYDLNHVSICAIKKGNEPYSSAFDVENKISIARMNGKILK